MEAANIVLIGMPGTGKSTVGLRLAKHIGFDFVDTDKIISSQTGKSLPVLIGEQGVDGFLALEGETGRTLQCERSVIATGGSMVFSEAAMQNLAKQGIVVWLDTDVEELEHRIRKHADRGIAAAPGTTIADIERQRRPLYQKYAQIKVNSQGGAEKVAVQIVAQLDAMQKMKKSCLMV